MQLWEYRTASLSSVLGFHSNKGWKLKAIDEQELPNWKNTDTYASIASFCNEMGRQGWELVSTVTFNDGIGLILSFKRPLE